MARILTYGNYGVFVLPERGQRHHLPHAHIKNRDQRVASIFLITLEVFDQIERLPPELITQIKVNQDQLLAAWEGLTGE